jgi:hypothetical protein
VAGQAKETVREVLVGVGRFSRAAASAKREKTLDYSEMVQVLQATRNLEIVLLGKVEFPEATSWPSLLSTGNSWDSFCCRNVRLEALGLIARAEQEATVSVFMQELSHGETVRVARTREALPEDLQGVVSFSVKVQGVRAVEIGLQRRRLAISSSKRASLRLPIEEEGDFSDKFSIANLVAGDQLTVLVVGGKNVSLHLNQREVSAQAVSGSTSGYLGVVRWKGSGGFVALMPPAIAIPLETQLPASPEPHQTPLSRLTLMPSAEEDSVLGAISRNLTAALYDERHPS